MSYDYNPHNWKNDPNHSTPINASNLNEMDNEIYRLGNDAEEKKGVYEKKDSIIVNSVNNNLQQGIIIFNSGSLNVVNQGIVMDVTDVQETNNMLYAVVDVGDYKKAYVKIKGGGTQAGGARAWAFLDENYVVLNRASMGYTHNGILAFPDGTKYLVLHTMVNELPDSYAYMTDKSIGTKIDDINADLLKKYDLTNTTKILADDNLNNYKTPGIYSTQTNAIANSVANNPLSVRFYLLVVKTYGQSGENTDIRQYIVSNTNTNNVTIQIQTRLLENGTWGSWQKILTVDDFNTIVNILFEQQILDLSHISKLQSYPYVINSNNRWIHGDYDSVFIELPINIGSKLLVKGGENEGYISFLTDDVIGGNNTVVTTWAGTAGRKVISSGQEYEFDIPENCKFVFVVVRVRAQNTFPDTIKLSGNVFRIRQTEEGGDTPETAIDTELTYNAPAMRVISFNSQGHDIPQNRGVLNFTKKIKQLKNIEWTALSDIPGSGSATAIAAGNHTGICYSSVKEYDKYVGWNVSIKTFMTAAHNPYSLLYTEDVLGSRSHSEYGKVYHGINCGAYFGIVCNIFALYGHGWEIPWNTAEFAYLNKIGILEKAYDQSAYGMRIGDIIWEPGHANVILDIERNDMGEPVYIYWGESISYFPQIRKYTPQEVDARLDTKNGIIYFSPILYKNLDYEPSEFVAVDGEIITPYQYNDDICTFAGDYACFNSSEDIYINYTAGNYTQMEIYKDDILLSTINIDSSLHKVKITPSGAGKYKARLKNNNTYSDYTYFEIVDTTVSCSYSNDILEVNFSSENGEPFYAQLTYRSGASRGIIPLTESDLMAGFKRFKPNDVLANQYPGDTFAETTYIKVFFKGDYGVVTNEYLNTGIV